MPTAQWTSTLANSADRQELNWVPTDPKRGFELMFRAHTDQSFFRRGIEASTRRNNQLRCERAMSASGPKQMRWMAPAHGI
jgi:hypothetical protein